MKKELLPDDACPVIPSHVNLDEGDEANRDKSGDILEKEEEHVGDATDVKNEKEKENEESENDENEKEKEKEDENLLQLETVEGDGEDTDRNEPFACEPESPTRNAREDKEEEEEKEKGGNVPRTRTLVTTSARRLSKPATFVAQPHWLGGSFKGKRGVELSCGHHHFAVLVKEEGTKEKYPVKLKEHLAGMSVEKDKHFLEMVKEWRFVRMEDRNDDGGDGDGGDDGGVCPCGVPYMGGSCYVIRNNKSMKETHVGVECIHWFEEGMAILHSLQTIGLVGKYKGLTEGGQLQFKVSTKSNIVWKRSYLLRFFQRGVPIYRTGKVWFIKVNTDDSAEFELDATYELKILARVVNKKLIFELLKQA